jgi:predicted phage terminase large subunit-like protein
VGIVGGMDHKGDVYILDRVKGKFGDVREVSDLVIDLHVKWKASITGIEKNHISMAMGPILKDRMRERSQYIALAEGKEALTPITDKLVRARTFQGLCRSGKVYVPEGDDWDSYISCMTAFTSTIHDDDIDASAWLGILLTRQPPPRNPSVVENAREAVVSAYDRLFKRRDEIESTGSYMSS